MNVKEIIAWLKSVYDKLILVCVLVGLLISFVLLNVLVDREKKNLAAARAAGPSGPTREATSLDTAWVQETMMKIEEPFQISDWTDRMMVPEIRVTCVACERPIPMEAETCPFRNCQQPQPEIPDEKAKDSTGDGIPDWWFQKYALDPFDPDGARQDPDGDGFTNLEEFLWGTDPTDPESHPPPVAKLRLERVGRLPMPLSFQGVSRTPDGEFIFTIRHLPKYRDYHVRLGQTVEGYEVVGYEPKTREVVRPGVPKPMQQDISELTIRRNDKDFELVIYREDQRGELAARLIYLIDNSEYLVTIGDEITLKKITYKVVDISSDVVIVKDTETGMESPVEFPRK